ncbi:MAG: inorganic diphosphatase [Candidatus Dormibacteraeota bacterium]|uniref:inorganic diphosphatase n=1 Tax=Candidatus Aeolococcus gillhamiae TaxID=3127015 RepID=A0A934N5B4_9BACT|nr:inorganic diphosphatase [Candidatus Dormibacteraeota bacterium]
MSDYLEVDVVIEVPKGSRNKFKWDASVGAIRLDRELFTATRYPADYGLSNQAKQARYEAGTAEEQPKQRSSEATSASAPLNKDRQRRRLHVVGADTAEGG